MFARQQGVSDLSRAHTALLQMTSVQKLIWERGTVDGRLLYVSRASLIRTLTKIGQRYVMGDSLLAALMMIDMK